MTLAFGRRMRALGRVDLRSVQRDPLLRIMPWLPLLVGGLIRLGGGVVVEQSRSRFGVDLTFTFPLIAAYILLLLAPAITGMVVGFLLLDQKDDRTLLAMRVTPLSLGNYLAYRLAMPMLVSALVTWLALNLAQLALSHSWFLVLCLLLSALIAPITALSLGTMAANKVQGFALAKALNIFMIAPVLAAFTPLPWQWLFGLLPTFWPARLLWALHFNEPLIAPIFIVGCAIEGLLLYWLIRRFSTSEI
ncbi:MAG: hypothetical protein U0175_15465 [Caldilineaceae bacterium]